MAGHIPRESIMMPVDYNDGEHPYRVTARTRFFLAP